MTTWSDVLGNDGGSAAEALAQIGNLPTDTVEQVARSISTFTRQVYSDPSDWMTPEEAEEVARDLLRDANSN